MDKYYNFIVNNDKKIVFAYVPKVACSNWKSIMRYLAGFSDYLDLTLAHDRSKSGLKYLSDIEDPIGVIKNKEIKKRTYNYAHAFVPHLFSLIYFLFNKKK